MKLTSKDRMIEKLDVKTSPHAEESIAMESEEFVAIKSRALSAMEEQTQHQLQSIQKQAELLAQQANDIKRRIEISYKIYSAKMLFEPLIGDTYHLYEQEGQYELVKFRAQPVGVGKINTLQFISSVTLLSDYTWEVVY